MVLAPGAVGLKFWRPAGQVFPAPVPNPTVLLHCNSVDGATNAGSLVDSSGNGFVFQAASPAVIDTLYTTKFGGSAVSCGGSGSIQGDGNTRLNFGTGDYTVDVWFYLDSTQSGSAPIIVFGSGAGSSDLRVLADLGAPVRVFDSLSATNVITGTSNVFSSVWHHAALTRSGGITRVFLNGVQEGLDWTDTKNYVNSSSEPRFGRLGINSFSGWLDEVRVVVGTAAWTSNFTPPTAPYPTLPSVLLHFDGVNGTTNIVDSSGNGVIFNVASPAVIDTSQSKFGVASLKTTAGILNSAGSDVRLSFGTGDFTIDFQFYENGSPTGFVYLAVFGGGSSSFPTTIGIPLGGSISVYDNQTASYVITGTAPTANVWHHVALTRSNGTTRLFMDGVQQGSNWTDTKNYSNANAANDPRFGGSPSLDGWMDEIRIVVGTADWTSNFTPPTSPYPSSPNQFLSVAQGSYSLSGQAATLTYVGHVSYTLPVLSGSYTLTGTPSTLIYIPRATALLHFDGTNGSTTIVDSSGNNFTFAVAGAAALDTSTAVFGASSLHLTGGSVQGTGAAGLNFGTGDYTVDFRFTNAAVSTGWDAATAGSGLVVTSTTVNGQGSGGSKSVRTNTSHSTGKYYVEMTIDVVNFKFSFGFANAALPDTGDLGNDANPSHGAAIFVNGIWYQNAPSSPPAVFSGSFVVNDKIDLAINFTDKLAWVRKNNGAWNPNLAGTQDPTATPGTGGGVDLNTQNGVALFAGPYYLAFSTWLTDATFRFSSTSWLNTPPSGYGQF